MAINTANVLAGVPDQAVTGAILSTVKLVTAPTDFFASGWDTDFKDCGYISEDGLTMSVSRSTNDIKDWSATVVKKILSEFQGTLKWSHLEVNEESFKTFFGEENVTVSAATATQGTRLKASLKAATLPHKSWAFRMKDGKAKIGIFVPDGQVTEADDITFSATDAIKLPVTLSCYPDKTGTTIYIYTDNGVFSA